MCGSRGCAIPVAWKVLPAHAKGSWRPYWEGLLAQLHGSVPTDWLVLVLADRGLYAQWLSGAIVRCGWHPFLRINLGVKARPAGAEQFDWLNRWVPRPGTGWQGTAECVVQKKSRLRCTLLLRWEEGYEHPWAVITDLAAQVAQVAWYSMRAWIEAAFKDLKRGGWGWHHSKMQDASRVERLGLAMAVALAWMVRLGSQAESEVPVAHVERLPPTHIGRQWVKGEVVQRSARRLSCPQRGRLVLLAALMRAEDWPTGAIMVEPWPENVTPLRRAVTSARLRQQAKKQARKRRYKAARRKKRAA